MSGDKRVVNALPRLRKARDPAQLAQRRKLLRAAGKDLMDVALMSHIEYQTVPLGIKNAVDGNGQLHHAEVRGQMSAGMRDLLDQKAPEFIAEDVKLQLVE